MPLEIPFMRRRLLVTASLVGLLCLASPGAYAQPAQRVIHIGVLESVPTSRNVKNLDALRQGLQALGYSEGRNLVIEYRSADGRAERFPQLAADLVRRNVDLIVARGTPATIAARNATTTVPVIMATMGDPTLNAASFARPGGNVTGVTTFSTELTAKRVELLKELVPKASRIGLLHNMSNPAVQAEWDETRRASRQLGIEAQLLDVRTDSDLRRAFAEIDRLQIDGLMVGADGLTQAHQDEIVELAARRKLPVVYPATEFVEAGGLVAYAVNYPELYRQLASHVDRIVRGAKPAELPIEQPTKFELVINLATANRLGIAVSQGLIMRAHDVIR